MLPDTGWRWPINIRYLQLVVRGRGAGSNVLHARGVFVNGSHVENAWRRRQILFYPYNQPTIQLSSMELVPIHVSTSL